jgi:hypothetical protein
MSVPTSATMTSRCTAEPHGMVQRSSPAAAKGRSAPLAVGEPKSGWPRRGSRCGRGSPRPRARAPRRSGVEASRSPELEAQASLGQLRQHQEPSCRTRARRASPGGGPRMSRRRSRAWPRCPPAPCVGGWLPLAPGSGPCDIASGGTACGSAWAAQTSRARARLEALTSQAASETSVLRPGTCLTWRALTSISSNSSSRVAHRAPANRRRRPPSPRCLTRWAFSQSLRRSRPWTVVANVATCCPRQPPRSGVRRHA